MKKIYTFLILSLGVIALSSLYSFSIGFATKNNNGITQAPLDWDADGDGVKETCARCHNDNNFDANLEIFVTDPNNTPILGYDPGAPYTIHVKINHATGTPAGYGFQMVGLIDADSSGLPSFTNLSANAKEVAGVLGRNYYEHNGGASDANEFTFDWTAPSDGAGSVTFYSSGIAANKNAANSGDGATNSKLTLTEGLILSNQAPITLANVRVMGNPSIDNIQLIVDSKKATDATIHLFDMNGQQLIANNTQFVAGVNQLELDASQVKQGVYILSVETKYGQITKKVLLMH